MIKRIASRGIALGHTRVCIEKEAELVDVTKDGSIYFVWFLMSPYPMGTQSLSVEFEARDFLVIESDMDFDDEQWTYRKTIKSLHSGCVWHILEGNKVK